MSAPAPTLVLTAPPSARSAADPTSARGAAAPPRGAGDTPSGEPAGADLDLLVAALRSSIDDLDRTVLGLIQERRALSRRIQQARVAAGGVRVELSREREVLGAYSAALGPDGTAIGSAVLRACRGRA